MGRLGIKESRRLGWGQAGHQGVKGLCWGQAGHQGAGLASRLGLKRLG